jgi:GntR family transcriptional regulator
MFKWLWEGRKQMLRINESSPIPIYLQIVEEIRLMILGKTFATDDRLPSIRQIAADLKVNPNTVAKAFQELENRGLIYFRRGQGAFVAKISEEDQKMRIIEDLNRKFGQVIKSAMEMGLGHDEIKKLFEKALNSCEIKEGN